MPASALLTLMTTAARKAGRGLTRDFGQVENLQVSVKGPGDFVSTADHKAEDIIFTELSRARPDYCYQMEERGVIEGADKSHRWIVDPLDGTTNFLHGIPLFCISIGLEREGEMVAGVIYNPIMEEMFSAEKGRGAFLNDQRRLQVAARKDLSDAVITTGIPHRGRSGHERFSRETAAVMAQCSGIRRTGSAALDMAWLAAGRFDGYWKHGLSPWDLAAGIVIIREAGGFVSDMAGGSDIIETGSIIAGNPHVHKALASVLGPLAT